MAKTRILMVEDELLAVEIISQALIFLGYEVVGVLNSGEEAVVRAAELRPDLILMDIVLSGKMDGIEAAEQITGSHGIPVVFITAYGDDSFFNRAKLTEPFGYLIKPVEATQLHHSIEMALYKHALNKQLRESENLYRTIFETTGGATMVVAGDDVIRMVNREFERFSGYIRKEVERRISLKEFFRGEELATILTFHHDRSSTPESVPVTCEATFYDRYGATKNMYLHIKMIPETERSIVSMFDITARKQLETAITRAKREWERTFDTVPDLIMLLDCDYRITRANRAQADRLGVTPAELIGKRCNCTIHGADEPPDICPNRLLLQDGREHFIEAYEPGLRGDFLISVTPLFDEEGTLTGSVHVARDITERKRVEAQLRESEAKFRNIYYHAPVMMHSVDEMGIIRDVNCKWLEELGYKRDDVIGRRHDFLMTPESVERSRSTVLPEFWRTGQIRNVPVQYLRKNGATVDVLLDCDATVDDAGRRISLSVVRDVTKQKLAAQQLNASLQEKEVLLKEIHHRVKNNMQVISSLLSLQAAYITDNQVRSIFSESRDRVKSMALIHEKLYNSVNLARINFSEYTRSLAAGIFRSYNISPQRIRLEVAIGELCFGVDTAIPCGLILNELISNSLKHAFPEERKGIISVSLSAGEGGGLKFVVGDDGVGFPPGIDFRTAGSLGLRLVNMLVSQLHGRIEKLPGSGTVFSIVIRA
jgi:PAS domain S-box-containing protein